MSHAQVPDGHRDALRALKVIAPGDMPHIDTEEICKTAAQDDHRP
jgi:hypothetical protein